MYVLSVRYTSSVAEYSATQKQQEAPSCSCVLISRCFSIASCKQPKKNRTCKWADCLRIYTTTPDKTAPAQKSHRNYNVI